MILIEQLIQKIQLILQQLKQLFFQDNIYIILSNKQ